MPSYRDEFRATDKAPQPHWSLDDWIEALNTRVTFIVSKAERLGFGLPTPTFNRWRNERIPDRGKALMFLSVLHQIAVEKDSAVLSCENLADHATIFLASKECLKDGRGRITTDELKLVCGHQRQSCHTSTLQGRVFRAPQSQLFGRDKIKVSLINTIRKTPVTVMTGFAGNGKTNLAWSVALDSLEMKEPFNCFDWTTDKRQFVDVDGQEKSGIGAPLTEDSILKSMIERFNWQDLNGLRDYKDRLDGCAERLKQTPYLIVIDNIETSDTRHWKDFALALLDIVRTPRNPSRVLFTSRQMIGGHNALQTQDLPGLDASAIIQFVQHQCQNWKTKLNERQIRALGEATDGNPLFLHIALHRLNLRQNLEEVLDSLRDPNRFLAFQRLFGPMLVVLHDNYPALHSTLIPLARLIAISTEPSLAYDRIWETWQIHCQNEKQTPLQAIFEESIDVLLEHHILSCFEDMYTMHPLIRAYLRSDKN